MQTGIEQEKGPLDREIDRRKKAESLLIQREGELAELRRELEEMNAALKVVIRQRAEDRSEMEKTVLANVKASVFPFLEKLKSSPLSEVQKELLREIEERLSEITSPFVRELSSGHLGLSPNEVQVAGLIREGRSSMEISQLLNISVHTVISYRYCIRKKTGLKGKKVNLRAYLQTLQGG